MSSKSAEGVLLKSLEGKAPAVVLLPDTGHRASATREAKHLKEPASTETIVRTKVSRNFKIDVPSQYADTAQAALRQWLMSRGLAVTIHAEPNGAQTALTFSSDDGNAPDLADPAIQAELQKVLVAALTGRR